MTKAHEWPFPPHFIYRDFLDEPERLALLDWVVAQSESFGASRLAYGEQDRVRRGSRSLPLKSDMGPWKDRFRDRVSSELPELFGKAGLKPFEISRFELEIVAYQDGDHFKAHRDTVRAGDGAGGRMLTGVYYFYREPKAFTGGELRLFRFGATAPTPDNFIDIAPEQNSFLIFPSWAMHEVRPVSTSATDFGQARFALNCWLHKAEI
jgi:Rps23 Pro-64 3,4-dihydroxylase Tpa1-like proline 4-hydroxylase